MSYVNLLLIILCVVTDRAAGQCDGVARQLSASDKESKDLTSPGYPRPYPSDSGCRWQIDTGSAEGIVRVYIYDVSFDEAGSCTPSNSLTLIDGLNPDTVLARLCKSEGIKGTYKSSGPYLQVLFYTGANTHGMSGFYMSYLALVNETSTSNTNDTNAHAILGVVGSAAGFLIILFIACACICCKKQNTQRANCREERTNTQRYRSRTDDAQTAVREGNGNAAYFSSSEDNLPPNYSDLTIRSDGVATETAVSLNPSVGERAGVDIAGDGGGGGSHGGGSVAAGSGEGGGEGGGLSREQSTVSTPPPIYDSSMIELFPPQPLPPTSSGDHEQVAAYESQCSVPPPTTGSPPPPLTPESSSLSPIRFA